MPTLAINLPTGYDSTAKIRTQPRAGGSWSTLIDPMSVVGNLYSYTVPAGDILVQLTGVSEQDGEPFRVRDGIAYFGQTWQQIDATITVPPVIPSPITGLCNVLFSVVNGSGSPVLKASCYAQLDTNSTYASGLAASTVYSAQTDANGLATLVTIRNQEFTSGGIYTLRATDRQGLLVWTKRVRTPNTASANAVDLVPI